MIYEVPRDELFLVGTSEVSARRAARRRDPRGRRAAAPLRGLLDLLPSRVRGRRQGHPRDLPRPPVRQGGDVLVRPSRRSLAPSTSGCSRSRSASCRRSDLPYRVVDIPVGDLGAPAARKFDCEAWIPSQSRYREVTSCSNTTDYQARRLDCRFRPEADAATRARAHPERHRRRGRADPDRADRERPARRRLRRAAARAGGGWSAEAIGGADPAVPGGRPPRAPQLEAPSSSRSSVKRAGVDAVALAGRVRAVVEDVAEVAAAARAEHLGAAHEQAVVGLGSRPCRRRPGSQKLGQPVPESNLVSELNSSCSAAGAAVRCRRPSRPSRRR